MVVLFYGALWQTLALDVHLYLLHTLHTMLVQLLRFASIAMEHNVLPRRYREQYSVGSLIANVAHQLVVSVKQMVFHTVK